ncbi:M6 family metalloprotease domain-containing protein [Vibrio natriegens]|uniref:Peptidase M6 n=1 Tax=Vibrio natriegens NBRC 15636 = ATCC 14048 = DSM 759 TaxID=1219067 RepID=A0AAN0Y174_VIBNA|nr:M6 family metalloprotease domain-containing protein [Vibrio natriegens]ALR16122.1 peptidase M6 [Vibrio natriegens NBRC 15636 = ATCC 14048 = DSM 759]ANQ12016.1 peptidase M6 [Vibrio natriegens NBRC 15636 = ATCC 14048 = DSM 759]EPM38694.1 peptidase M6 [Vibrio natriegens NBRC 15636 = ATCC 14048 = DSM 759]MDX6026371.1 M6 family metalloprotease domain-containing protein [Vibrio natriegens NBRC 15636 = ATCC 14048 = DSM 759]UUI12474.1 M6 family metalloprotease domain-containing protein [Vibrio natr
MKFNLVALTVLSALLAGKSMATTPPSPIWHEIKLTDGTSSEAILRGTPDFHWFEDKQGNALIQRDGEWFFAQVLRESDALELVSTGIKKTQTTVAPESSKSRPDLSIQPHLSSLRTMEPMARKNLLRAASDTNVVYRAMSSSGVTQQPLLVVQVSFTNQVMKHDFEQRVFDQNGQSVVDYYDKNSLGKYKVIPAIESYGTVNDGVIDVTVPLRHPDCHASTSDSLCTDKMNLVFAEAYRKLDPYIDLSSYDRDRDGTVDATELSVMFVFAGGDRSTGVLNKPAIWPHRYFHNDVQIDGTTIKDYCLFADYQATHQSTLGVIVHELGHLMLGLPDLYARYSKASIGTWGVMGAGSWAMKPGDSYPGETPVNMTAWSRHAAGFVVPTIAHQSNMPHGLTDDEVKLVYLDPYLKEYGPRVYLENRTFKDYDQALAAEGVLAMSVNILNQFNGLGDMQVQVMQADGRGELEKGERSDQGDLYPNGGSEISDFSNPGLNVITGFDTDVSISDISSSANGGSFLLTKLNDANKSAWLNTFHQEFVFSNDENVLAVLLDLSRDTELDGLQIYAEKSSPQRDMTFRVWRFPNEGNNEYSLVLNQQNAELLQQGSFKKSSRILFPHATQLSAGQHIIVVEIEGGEFEESFNFSRLLDMEKATQPKMWVGKSSEQYSEGLLESSFSTVPFAVLLNYESAKIVEAQPDSYQTDKNTVLSLNLMSNDVVASDYQFEVEVFQQPVHGTFTDNQYQPDHNFVGFDSFQYRLVSADGSLASSAVNVSIEVIGFNAAPNAVIDVINTELKAGNRVSLSAANSSDPDGDALTYQWKQVAGDTLSLSNPSDVTASFEIPKGAKAGDVFTFQLTVTDVSAALSIALVELEVQNSAPIASADAVTVAVNERIVIDVLANDTDMNGDSLVVQSVDNVSGIGSAYIENGKVTYQAPDSAADNVTLEYVISDGTGATAKGAISVEVVAASSNKGKSSGGGGSVGNWSLLLLALLGWRRRH